MRSRVWARGGKAQAPWGPVWLCSGTCSLGASDLTSDGEFTPAGLLSLRLQSRGAMLPAALLQLCTEKAHLSTRLPVTTWPTGLGPGRVRRARAPCGVQRPDRSPASPQSGLQGPQARPLSAPSFAFLWAIVRWHLERITIGSLLVLLRGSALESQTPSILSPRTRGYPGLPWVPTAQHSMPLEARAP